VRVTVIATGFSKGARVEEPGDGNKGFEIYPLKDFEPKKQPKPVPRELPIMSGGFKKRYDEDDYDIPAFLRRKAD
jgi:hypothetical protein